MRFIRQLVPKRNVAIMAEHEWLAEKFEENRGHLRAVAYRMLGSLAEADDAVQEAWLRLSRSYADEIENLGGWLTTLVSRVCLDMLRSRNSRKEEALESQVAALAVNSDRRRDPEQETLLANSIVCGPAGRARSARSSRAAGVCFA